MRKIIELVQKNRKPEPYDTVQIGKTDVDQVLDFRNPRMQRIDMNE